MASTPTLAPDEKKNVAKSRLCLEQELLDIGQKCDRTDPDNEVLMGQLDEERQRVINALKILDKGVLGDNSRRKLIFSPGSGAAVKRRRLTPANEVMQALKASRDHENGTVLPDITHEFVEEVMEKVANFEEEGVSALEKWQDLAPKDDAVLQRNSVHRPSCVLCILVLNF